MTNALKVSHHNMKPIFKTIFKLIDLSFCGMRNGYSILQLCVLIYLTLHCPWTYVRSPEKKYMHILNQSYASHTNHAHENVPGMKRFIISYQLILLLNLAQVAAYLIKIVLNQVQKSQSVNQFKNQEFIKTWNSYCKTNF